MTASDGRLASTSTIELVRCIGQCVILPSCRAAQMYQNFVVHNVVTSVRGDCCPLTPNCSMVSATGRLCFNAVVLCFYIQYCKISYKLLSINCLLSCLRQLGIEELLLFKEYFFRIIRSFVCFFFNEHIHYALTHYYRKQLS